MSLNFERSDNEWRRCVLCAVAAAGVGNGS